MHIYFDTSALVPIFVQEPSTALLKPFAKDTRHLFHTNTACYAEFHAALAQRLRLGSITEEAHAFACDKFELFWQDFHVLPVDMNLAKTAAQFALALGLRGYDSIHLASAVLIKNVLNETVHFACLDKRLSAAALVAGLTPLF
jgi:uncharacterized protein